MFDETYYFREEYVNDLDQKIQSLSEECHNLRTCSYIQNIHTELPSIMIKAARKAERSMGRLIF